MSVYQQRSTSGKKWTVKNFELTREGEGERERNILQGPFFLDATTALRPYFSVYQTRIRGPNYWFPPSKRTKRDK